MQSHDHIKSKSLQKHKPCGTRPGFLDLIDTGRLIIAMDFSGLQQIKQQYAEQKFVMQLFVILHNR